MPDTFLLNCLVILKKSAFETRKNTFHFTSKALSVFEIFKFQNFRILNFMTSSTYEQNKKCVLLNNLESKHYFTLLVKFSQFT